MLTLRRASFFSALVLAAACGGSQTQPGASPPAGPDPNSPVESPPAVDPETPVGHAADPPPVADPNAPATPAGTADKDGCFSMETPVADVAKARRDKALSQADLWKGLGPPPAAWSSCQSDADCKTVEVGCCDHCNGGRLVAVAAKHEKDASTKYKPKKCGGACTERGCAEGVPLCNDNKCTFYVGWSHPKVCADKNLQ